MIGAQPVDAGGLIMSRLVEPAMMLVTTLAVNVHPQRDVALALLERA
jgi:predicted dinucleotide-binding enzyme